MIKPLGGMMRLCVDGEITDAGETVFEIEHNAFDFVLPIKTSNIRGEERSMVHSAK